MAQSFLEFYDNMSEDLDNFYVGKIKVNITEISQDLFDCFSEAETTPAPTYRYPKSLASLPTKPLKKWRLTYTVNGKEITNYLTAMNKDEAMAMLGDHLNLE